MFGAVVKVLMNPKVLEVITNTLSTLYLGMQLERMINESIDKRRKSTNVK